MPEKFISITEGRKRLFKIAEEVQRPDTYYTFTVSGKPRVVLMSKQEFDSMLDTMEILSNPETIKDIRKAENDFEKGNYSLWDNVKKELTSIKHQELVLKEKPKRGYGKTKK